MEDYSLIIEDLVKYYGDVKAVNHISLKVKKGDFFAFLGENGAGKSTTINIICSILAKDSGKVFINGKDLDFDSKEIKKDIGVVFQTSVLDALLTVEQNLRIRSSFYFDNPRKQEAALKYVIDLLDLKDILKRQFNKLSGGQKRRVDIAKALIHQPSILVLDEPTTGLDPKTRKLVWNLINEVREKTKMTVFLTTHYLEEASKASYVCIMNKGKIVAEGTPVELKNKYAKDSIIVYENKNQKFEECLIKNKFDFHYSDDRHAYIINFSDKCDTKTALNKIDKYISDFEIIKGTLDDVFLKVINEEIVLKEEV